jgi:dCMP deaminase
MGRIDKINYYLDIAESTLERSTCIRRCFGAVLVKNDEIIGTGYNGAPRGRKNCDELGMCLREKLKVPRGERYELCRSVHAEQNAIISAERSKMLGSSLYLVGKNYSDGKYVEKSSRCSLCKRMIINAGIKDIYIRDSKTEYRHIEVEDYITNDESIIGTSGY